jgi:hypothetical protein
MQKMSVNSQTAKTTEGLDTTKMNTQQVRCKGTEGIKVECSPEHHNKYQHLGSVKISSIVE